MIDERQVKKFMSLRKLETAINDFAQCVDEIRNEKEAIEKCKGNYLKIKPNEKRKQELERRRDQLKKQIENLK